MNEDVFNGSIRKFLKVRRQYRRVRSLRCRSRQLKWPAWVRYTELAPDRFKNFWR